MSRIVISFVISLLSMVANSMEVSWGDLLNNENYTLGDTQELTYKDIKYISSYSKIKNASFRRNLDDNEKLLMAMYSNHINSNLPEISEYSIDELNSLNLKLIDWKQKKVNEINPHILDSDVYIEGFPVPIELNGNKVTSFILVPTPGACIHIPPPPKNQMIVVHYSKGVILDDIYTSITVRGNINASKGKHIETRARLRSPLPCKDLRKVAIATVCFFLLSFDPCFEAGFFRQQV